MPAQTVVDVTQMAEVQEVIQGILDEIQAEFDNANYSVSLRLISKEIERFEERVFESEKSPGGSAWQPLAPSTVKRKGHDVILHNSGRLGASLFGVTGDSIRDVDHRFLTFGSSVPYSGFLQDGTSRMPAREHVGLDDEMCDLIAEYIADGAVVSIGGTP